MAFLNRNTKNTRALADDPAVTMIPAAAPSAAALGGQGPEGKGAGKGPRQNAGPETLALSSNDNENSNNNGRGNNDNQKSGSKSAGGQDIKLEYLIIGACVLGLILICCLYCCWRKCCRSKKSKAKRAQKAAEQEEKKRLAEEQALEQVTAFAQVLKPAGRVDVVNKTASNKPGHQGPTGPVRNGPGPQGQTPSPNTEPSGEGNNVNTNNITIQIDGANNTKTAAQTGGAVKEGAHNCANSLEDSVFGCDVESHGVMCVGVQSDILLRDSAYSDVPARNATGPHEDDHIELESVAVSVETE